MTAAAIAIANNQTKECRSRAVREWKEILVKILVLSEGLACGRAKKATRGSILRSARPDIDIPNKLGGRELASWRRFYPATGGKRQLRRWCPAPLALTPSTTRQSQSVSDRANNGNRASEAGGWESIYCDDQQE